MKTRKSMRKLRQRRIRAVVRGSGKRPRFSVYHSGSSLYVQLIDDETGQTLAALRSSGKNITAASILGKEIAAVARKRHIVSVVFDRGGNRYHGVMKALADAAREGGLKF